VGSRDWPQACRGPGVIRGCECGAEGSGRELVLSRDAAWPHQTVSSASKQGEARGMNTSASLCSCPVIALHPLPPFCSLVLLSPSLLPAFSSLSPLLFLFPLLLSLHPTFLLSFPPSLPLLEPTSRHSFPSQEHRFFNFMAVSPFAVTLDPKKIKSVTASIIWPRRRGSSRHLWPSLLS